jgi:hypothetical protein
MVKINRPAVWWSKFGQKMSVKNRIKVHRTEAPEKNVARTNESKESESSSNAMKRMMGCQASYIQGEIYDPYLPSSIVAWMLAPVL